MLAALLAVAALGAPGASGWSPEEAAALDRARGLAAGPGLTRSAPFPYSLVLVPAVALGGARGAMALNALLVCLAAWIAARRLGRDLDGRGPLLVAVLLFGSTTFLSALAVRPEAFLLAATVAAFALARGAPPAAPEIFRGSGQRLAAVATRWTAVGLLLAIPALAHPLYLLLFLAAAAARPPSARLLAAAGLVLGGALLLGGAAAVHGGQSGGWSPWVEAPNAVERAVRTTALGASGRAGAADLAHRRAPGLEPAVAGWNLAYCLVGRHHGLLPYFLPLLVLLACRRRGEPGSAMLWAVGLIVLGFVLLRPFEFAGGGGAGNRWFVPLYGALWLLPERGPRAPWSLGALALAALFVWPLWLAPREAIAGGVSPRLPSPVARRVLPYETTQRELPAAAEWNEGELWLRSPGPEIERTGERLRLVADAWGRLLVASPGEGRALMLEFGPRASTRLEIENGRLTETVYRPDGGLGFRLELGEPRARHRMWFTGPPRAIYFVGLRMTAVRDAGIEFRLLDGGATNGDR